MLGRAWRCLHEGHACEHAPSGAAGGTRCTSCTGPLKGAASGSRKPRWKTRPVGAPRRLYWGVPMHEDWLLQLMVPRDSHRPLRVATTTAKQVATLASHSGSRWPLSSTAMLRSRRAKQLATPTAGVTVANDTGVDLDVLRAACSAGVLRAVRAVKLGSGVPGRLACHSDHPCCVLRAVCAVHSDGSAGASRLAGLGLRCMLYPQIGSLHDDCPADVRGDFGQCSCCAHCAC
eukprot:jgi/Ulvmu1/10439/UM062_0036.1